MSPPDPLDKPRYRLSLGISSEGIFIVASAAVLVAILVLALVAIDRVGQ